MPFKIIKEKSWKYADIQNSGIYIQTTNIYFYLFSALSIKKQNVYAKKKKRDYVKNLVQRKLHKRLIR